MTRLPLIIAAWLAAACSGCRQTGPQAEPQPGSAVRAPARERAPHADAGADATPRSGRPLTETEAIEAVRASPDVKELLAAYGEDAEARLKIQVTDRDERVFTVQVSEAASGGRTVSHGIFEVDRKSGEVIRVEL